MIKKTTTKPKNNITIKNKKPVVHRELDEIKGLDEPLPKVVSDESPPAPPKKQAGRKKNADFLSYTEAREFMHGELIPSRKNFHEWWDRNKPKAIPRFPYRVYKEWTSWNDFLGTNNEFGLNTTRTWRPMEEAALWVHSLRIESYTKWLDYCKETGLPNDIPTRPDLVYRNWKTWGHWLGNRPVETLEMIKEAQRLQIYYIIHEADVPQNVFTFGVEPMGPTVFKERWEREKFDIMRMFWFDPEHSNHIQRIIDGLSTPYLDNMNQRICPNMWEINYYLEITLQRIVRL